MNLEFLTNDYLLAWNLLFKPSFSEEVQSLKEKLWQNYPNQYMKMEKENIEILKYSNDFIPDDDTVYTYVFDTDVFKKIKDAITIAHHYGYELPIAQEKKLSKKALNNQ